MNNSAETIGFIGVGLMGHGIAKNLLLAGYPVYVLAHRNRAPIDDLRKALKLSLPGFRTP